ncbi:MAG: sel1 repeat family protein [Chthoniobacterales bacterium]|nr:sel1 repeat family protein [Chthoniobacterales bacterium]
MKVNRLVCIILSSVVPQLPAQQSEADRELLANLRTEADKGDAERQWELGNAFLLGDLGAAKDAVEAVKWYRKATEQNLAEAQSMLGSCYAEGEGVAKDHREAVKWNPCPARMI